MVEIEAIKRITVRLSVFPDQASKSDQIKKRVAHGKQYEFVYAWNIYSSLQYSILSPCIKSKTQRESWQLDQQGTRSIHIYR